MIDFLHRYTSIQNFEKHKVSCKMKTHFLRPNRKNTWSKSSRFGSTPPRRYWSNISNKTEKKYKINKIKSYTSTKIRNKL